MLTTISLYTMAAFYTFAGVMHFVKPKLFVRMIPPALPFHLALVYISGVAEIVLGIGLLYPPTRIWAAWGVIALLIAVFPANYYMFRNPRQWRGIPRWGLALRLPLQLVLIAWAYYHTLP